MPPAGIRMSSERAGEGDRLRQYASGLPTFPTGACVEDEGGCLEVSFAASLLKVEGKLMCFFRWIDGAFLDSTE